jgi:hypothetical protein
VTSAAEGSGGGGWELFVVAATVYVERFLRVWNERLDWGRQGME